MTPADVGATQREFALATHTLRYLEWGPADAPPLVLLHGGLDNAYTWSDLARLLAGRWRVIALDLRGHGDSDWSSTGDYLPLSYLGDIAAFLKAVGGWPASVIAHSMGARLALQLMGVMPEAIARLVAIEGLGGERVAPAEGTSDPKMDAWLAARRARAAPSLAEQAGAWVRARLNARRDQVVHADLDGRIRKQLANPMKRLTPAQAEAFIKSSLRPQDGGFVWKYDPICRWQNANEIVEPQRPYWQAIQGPVLHLFGAQSWNYPPAPEDLAAFRRGRLVTVEDAGHWVHLNQAPAVAEAVEAFLEATADIPA
jgi:pimeloyl-ACP methyl ester carboxylesterase